jgi:hypothetical protein
VLQVDSIGDVFSAFRASDDDQLAELARLFLSLSPRWVGEWCCTFVPQGTPGDVWYDLFSDIEGHRDRADNVRSGPWQPRLGGSKVELRDCKWAGPLNMTTKCDMAAHRSRPA